MLRMVLGSGTKGLKRGLGIKGFGFGDEGFTVQGLNV